MLPVTSERIAAFASAWGQDRFVQEGSAASRSADWVFIGLNSERLGSGLPEEDEQWDWLAGTASQSRGKSVMLFLHKPLWSPMGSRSGITPPEAARDRLVALFADPGRGLEPGTPGIVEYLIEDDDVRAALRPVPGLGGVSDVMAMPEFTAAMAEIEAR